MLGSDWIEETRSLLLTGKQEALDRIAADIGTEDNLIRIEGTSQALRPGSLLELGIESCYVRTVDQQPSDFPTWERGDTYAVGARVVSEGVQWPRSIWLSTTAGVSTVPPPDGSRWLEAAPFAGGHGGILCSVIRGHEGSTPIAHASNEVVRVAPTFSAWRIWRALKNAISELSSPTKLYRVLDIDIDRSQRLGDLLYPLTLPEGTEAQNVQRAISARFRVPEYRDSVEVRGPLRLVYDARLPNDTRAAVAIRIDDGQVPWDPRMKVKVRLACDLVALTDPTQAVVDLGLPDTALDIPPIVAAFHLMSTLPGRFILPDAASEPRAPGDLAAGSGQSAVSRLRQVYRDRVMEEVRGLQSRYGAGRVW